MVKVWPERGISLLQQQLQDNDWGMFASQATSDAQTDINIYTSSVLDHINMCIDNVTTVKHVKHFPNHKPWRNSEVHLLLKARNAALKSGDTEDYSKARANLKRGIRKAKHAHKLHIKEHFHSNSNPKCMWKGIQTTTDHKPSIQPLPSSNAFLPDELNHFFARFDKGIIHHTRNADSSTVVHPISLSTTEEHSARNRSTFKQKGQSTSFLIDIWKPWLIINNSPQSSSASLSIQGLDPVTQALQCVSHLTFQSLEVQDGSRRAVGFQRRHSLCPVTLPNSKFNIGGGVIDPADELWSLASINNQPWNREQLPRSALQRIPFRADRSVSMIEGHVSGESTLPPPPGLSISPPGLSVSPPSPRATPVPAVSARYKTELCRTYEESGACKYGAKCQFAHGAEELRGLNRHPKYKTEPCRTFHTVGFCPYGARCHFIHNADEQQQHRQATSTTRDRPRLLRQSVSFAGFSSRATVTAFQALPDPLAFTRAASVSPPPSSSFSCSPDLPSPPLLPEHGALKHGFGFRADIALGDRISALQRSTSADSLSDHDGYSSSGSLSGCDSPGVDGSRRLPIFSRLSVSDD
ncbi:hypothetical protein QTP86_010249 [Hemibagrus guttatus]|nr:hypothetical protein QTP86_010249 [Hemibagrus guttatus]